MLCQVVVKRGWIGLLRGLGFRCGKAAGDEERIDIFAHCALDIGVDAVANAQDFFVGDCVARQACQAQAGEVVNGRVRFAEIEAVAATLCISSREGACAINALVTAIHNDIGIGAEEFQVAVFRLEQQRIVIFGCFCLVVEKPGANDALGIFKRNSFNGFKTLEEVCCAGFIKAEIAIRAEMIDFLTHKARGKGKARAIAGGGDFTPQIIADADGAQLVDDARFGSGGVGEQKDDAARCFVCFKRFHGLCEGSDAVMQTTPKVAKDSCVIVRNVRKMIDYLGHELGDSRVVWEWVGASV